MSWLSLVITLLLEQVRPLPTANPVYGGVRQISAWAERNLNAGRWQHGVYAWLLVVVGLALVVGAIYSLAVSIHWLLGLAVNVMRALLRAWVPAVQPSRHRDPGRAWPTAI